MPTGHWNSHAPQVVHWKTACLELYLPIRGSSEAGPRVVQVAAQAEDDFFRVELFAGVGCGAMFSAAAALHAGVGLQADELREVGSGNKAEVFIAD